MLVQFPLFNVKTQLRNTKQANQELADQESPKVSVDTKFADADPDTGDAYGKTTDVVKKGTVCFAKAVQDTKKRGVHIQKRANPS